MKESTLYVMLSLWGAVKSIYRHIHNGYDSISNVWAFVFKWIGSFGLELTLTIAVLVFLSIYKKRKKESFQDTIDKITGANKVKSISHLEKKIRDVLKEIETLKKDDENES